MRVDVVIEATAKKAFASALEWPGWSRSGKTEEAAIEALSAYRDRYAAIGGPAADLTEDPVFHVIERVTGNATTTFGAPDVPAAVESDDLSAAEARRIADLVRACWDYLDDVVAHAPQALRKGPRGGGRDRDAVVAHVLAAEKAYASKIGLSHKVPAPGDAPAVAAMRDDILAALTEARQGAPLRERGWGARYAARRIAWHVLDHAWEIEDKS